MQASQQLNRPKIICRASFHQRVISGLILLVVVTLFGSLRLVVYYKINIGRAFGLCGFKQRYGLPCPACGMSTSAVAFAQGKIFESFYIQPAAALLCSVAVVSAFLAFLIAVFGVYFSFLKRFFCEVKVKYIILALIIIIAAGWAVTLARALAAK